MKYRVLDLLQDIDGGPFRVVNPTIKPVHFDRQLTGVQCKSFCAFKNRPVTPTSVSVNDCTKCYSQELIQGELLSSSGNRYPIVKGIPRLLSKATAGWVAKNQTDFLPPVEDVPVRRKKLGAGS